MTKDKGRDSRDILHDEEDHVESGSRARNRTVMLTPEMTGQVRALVNTEKLDGRKKERVVNPMSQLLPPMGWSSPAAKEEPKPATSVTPEQEDMGYEPVIKQEPQEEKQQTMEATEMSTPAPESSKRTTATFNTVSAQPIVHKRKGKVAAFLISFDNDATGEVYEISTGRWLITSRPTDQGDYILLDDESISPLHAIIRALDNGKIQVLDQLSEFGTFVTKPNTDSEEEISGSTVLLEHGTGLRFGNRRFVVCLVPVIKSK
ncbi:MAG: FHA domain-containing protein [Deltaproteobacteria bacterium]|nr:FHA domain-containing protein [Deltaproteobacteria bacterium]